MVDILVDWQRQEFDFNGEKIAMELMPMDVGTFFKLMAIDPKSPDEKQIEVMTGIFEKYVRNIENLTVNSKPVIAAQLANLPALMGLAGKIMARLTEISNLPETEIKN